MKKKVFFITVWIALIFFAACAPQKKKTEVKPTTPIKIAGSGTCRPLMEILIRAYSKLHPEIKFKFLPITHSKGGVEGVAQGLLDIGLVSRELKPEEKALGVTYLLLSNDGLVIATHPSIKIKNLSTQQVKDIYSGKIKKWKELGGPNVPIIVMDRNEDESAKIILRQYVLGKSLTVTKKASIMYYESDMVKALERTPYSIGYLSFGYAISKKLPLNILSLDGVKPSVASILNGQYRVVRPMGIVYKNPSGPVKNLIEFLSSPEAKEIMIKNGFAPSQAK